MRRRWHPPLVIAVRLTLGNTQREGVTELKDSDKPSSEHRLIDTAAL